MATDDPASLLLQGAEDLDRRPDILRPLHFGEVNPGDEIANLSNHLEVIAGRPFGAEVIGPDQDHLLRWEPAL